jgi:hypothetical protein
MLGVERLEVFLGNILSICSARLFFDLHQYYFDRL